MKAEKYYNDYENEPIGGGNPYNRCVSCGMSDPEINGRLERHKPWCEYRQRKEFEIRFEELERLSAEYQSPETQRLIEIGRATEKAFNNGYHMDKSPEYKPGIGIVAYPMVVDVETLTEWSAHEGKAGEGNE